MTPRRFLQGLLPLLWLAALLAGCAHREAEQGPPVLLAPEGKRISDEVIARDRRLVSDLRQRHDTLQAQPAEGDAMRSYLLSKAQCWVRAGAYQYDRNDRSRFPEEALQQAVRLLDAVEHRVAVPTETPLINRASRLREDLWQRAQQLKTHPAWSCAAAQLACAEVDLVQGGDQYAKFGWRSAHDHVARAEERLERAHRQAEACLPEPVPAPVTPLIQRTRSERLVLEADALFQFDRASLAHARPEKLAALQRLAAELLQLQAIERVHVVGHTDEMGSVDYNLRLSRLRAQAVADYLLARGVPAQVLTVEGRGKAEPVASCESVAERTARIACLAPNRRVEIEVRGMLRAQP